MVVEFAALGALLVRPPACARRAAHDINGKPIAWDQPRPIGHHCCWSLIYPLPPVGFVLATAVNGVSQVIVACY